MHLPIAVASTHRRPNRCTDASIHRYIDASTHRCLRFMSPPMHRCIDASAVPSMLHPSAVYTSRAVCRSASAVCRSASAVPRQSHRRHHRRCNRRSHRRCNRRSHRLCNRCDSLRLAAARCGSLRLAAARCHFGQAFARVLRGRAPLAPSPRDKRLSELPRRCMGASAVAGMYFDCSHVSDCCPDTVHSWNDPAPCRVGSRPLGCIGRLGCIGGPSAVPSAVSIPRRFISPGLSAAPLRQSHRRHHRRCIRWSLAAPSLVGRSRRRP